MTAADTDVSPLRYALLLLLIWTAIAGSSLYWSLDRQNAWELESVRIHARTALEKDILYRRWNSGHGGIYVPVTATTAPNPYLGEAHRDVNTDVGQRLTLVNPAYMTRQVYELGGGSSGMQSHLTSLDPIRPGNRPDGWERAALQAFERGETEVSSVEWVDGQPYMRLMHPLMTKADCLVCHVEQRFYVGQNRGGISVAVPMQPYLQGEAAAKWRIYVAHGVLWLLGVGGLALGTRKQQQRFRERQVALRALRESEERFQLLFEEAPLGYQSLDEEGRFLEVNDTWLRFTGYERDEVIGHPFEQFLVADDRERYRNNFPHFKRVGEIHGVEYRIQKKDGSHAHAQLHGKIGRDPTGAFRQTHCLFQDVTEHKRAEQERQDLEQKLLHSQKMEAIGTLAGGVAHDFNNLLAVIMGYSEMALKDAEAGSAQGRRLQNVLRAAHRAKEVVRQILAFSRRGEQKKESIWLAEVVAEALKLLRASIPASVAIEQELSPECERVLADPTQIHQIMMNLCTNAYHAIGSDGGTIRVALFPVDSEDPGACPLPPEAIVGNYACLQVSDTGCGMDRETQQRMFEPYFSTKAVGEGSGLGLAVVHGIVADHGGYLTVDTEPGQGSAFRVFLPFRGAWQGEVSADVPAALDGPERVLMVDDEELMAKLGKEMLEDLGYAVQVAANGERALSLFAAQPHQFDLIITDQAMPQMTGLQLARAVHAVRGDIPVLICTGNADMLDQEQVRRLGAQDLILKPFDQQTIGAAVRRALDA